ncbi:MAG: hypothetical protein AVDCRST_MAG85-331 [uncultured Solirubrobacteraceae bacterium]|uniref:Uncharacterized protein n=1 Tax=uncultured Solirubrobacteraceae bacterium TaxID=1162706 RepID=A0A6J4RL32_9ACTN|nr:MAG: hypothetical protein AVDCRST_MAG85-331 [uncultured Solirubrobacteraceae bacterium]
MANARGRISGAADVALSERGRSEGTALGGHLDRQAPDVARPSFSGSLHAYRGVNAKDDDSAIGCSRVRTDEFECDSPALSRTSSPEA